VNAGIVLERLVAVDVFGDGAGHEELAMESYASTLTFFGHVEPGLVGNDAGFEAGALKFFCDVLPRFCSPRAKRDVGLGGEGFEFFAGQLRIGNGEEGLIGFRLLSGGNRNSRKRRRTARGSEKAFARRGGRWRG